MVAAFGLPPYPHMEQLRHLKMAFGKSKDILKHLAKDPKEIAKKRPLKENRDP